MSEKIDLKEKAFVISSTFNANRELMWKMWTESEHIKHWWGPKGAQVKYIESDLHIKSMTLYHLITPDGQDIWGKQVYREIVNFERLVFVNSLSDRNGGITRHPLSPTWPLEIFTTVIFDGHQHRTNVIVKSIPINASDEEIKTFDSNRDSLNQGWEESFEQLQDYLHALQDSTAHASMYRSKDNEFGVKYEI